MDIEQNLSQSEQVSQDSFDVFEDKQAQAVFSAFFGDCSEEEQLILREFGSKFNIRANDALWAIAGVFVFLGGSATNFLSNLNPLLMKVSTRPLKPLNRLPLLLLNLSPLKLNPVSLKL